ncbi:uncharacterized protein PAC_03700 [Phialocephala subalpina]|uniref:Ste24 endopeptidase n=1 Tax=Phialocephala subalpina TaxID=576137 RepID=A0A1L7WM22_9HELO|nr:uncharacterized protein PAC_03700 [Phialocephala subalpina]
MDIQKTSTPSEPSVIFTKNVALYSAFAIFALKCYINWRQLQVLARSSSLADSTTKGARAWQSSKETVMGKTVKSFWIFVATINFLCYDGVTQLWTMVETYQTRYMPALDSEFWRSSLFLLVCFLVYQAFDALLSVLGRITFKEYAALPSDWKWNELILDVMKGRPIPAVLLLFAVNVLTFKAFGWKIQGNFPFFVFMAQAISPIVLYPLILRSRLHNLASLEPGSLRDAITESAAEIKFPLKDTNVLTGPLESLEQGVQLLDWPFKTNVAVHEVLLERFTIEEILGLLASRFGNWKLRISLINNTFSMIFFGNMFTFMLMFIKDRSTYEDFGFVDQFPMMAGVVLFSISMALPCSTYMYIQRNMLSHTNSFAPDKHAADNGNLANLQAALGKIAELQQEGPIDWLFSLYWNGEASISERLTRLEKIAREKVGKEDVAVEKEVKMELA